MALPIFFSFSGGVILTSAILVAGPYSTVIAYTLGIVSTLLLVAILLRLTSNHWSWSWRRNHHTIPSQYVHPARRRNTGFKPKVPADAVVTDVASALRNLGADRSTARKIAVETRMRYPSAELSEVLHHAAGAAKR